MISPRARYGIRSVALLTLLASLAGPLCACTAAGSGTASPDHAMAAAAHGTRTAGPGTPRTAGQRPSGPRPPMPAPARLTLFGGMAYSGEGSWHPAGRLVDGMPAIYETTVIPPGGTRRASRGWIPGCCPRGSTRAR